MVHEAFAPVGAGVLVDHVEGIDERREGEGEGSEIGERTRWFANVNRS